VVRELSSEVIAKTRVHAPGFDEDSFRLGYLLAVAWGRLERDFEAQVHRPRGLTWGGFRLLFCLWAAGPLETAELARLLGISTATVSSVVRTLEAKGWVERERHTADQRRVTVRSTTAGAALAADALQAQNERETAWMAGLDETQRGALRAALEHLARRPRPASGVG